MTAKAGTSARVELIVERRAGEPRGRVLDETGEPVAGASVDAQSQPDRTRSVGDVPIAWPEATAREAGDEPPDPRASAYDGAYISVDLQGGGEAGVGPIFPEKRRVTLGELPGDLGLPLREPFIGAPARLR